MINKTLLATCGLVTASLIAVGAGQQQDAAPKQATGNMPSTRVVRTKDSSPEGQTPGQAVQYFVPTRAQQEIDGKISEAAKAFRQAKPNERTAAINSLTTLLSSDYDARLDGYDEYLNQLATKLVEMRGKLQKQREAKEEMIKLRVKVLEAEVEDLGWPVRLSGKFPSLSISSPGDNVTRGEK